MPTPIATVTAAAIVAAGGYGIGNAVLGSGGTSNAPAAHVPALAPDPTGRPDHTRFTYQPPGAQDAVPALPAPGGQAPNGDPAPAGGSAYVPHGKLLPPLGHVPVPGSTPAATTWKLFLSGDLLQPDPGAAEASDQSIGPQFGGACGHGFAGKWTGPATANFPLHGTVPGLLQVVTSGPTTLQIAMTSWTYGGGCTVMSSTSVLAPGSGPVQFTLPRVDFTVPFGSNMSLVVAASSSAHITSSQAAPSYVIAPTSPK